MDDPLFRRPDRAKRAGFAFAFSQTDIRLRNAGRSTAKISLYV